MCPHAPTVSLTTAPWQRRSQKEFIMKCPLDHTDLLLTDRHGIEIAYCPYCRGIWLDHGKLDILLQQAQASSSQRWSSERSWDTDDDDDRDRYDHHRDGGSNRRRESFLGDRFDV